MDSSKKVTSQTNFITTGIILKSEKNEDYPNKIDLIEEISTTRSRKTNSDMNTFGESFKKGLNEYLKMAYPGVQIKSSVFQSVNV